MGKNWWKSLTGAPTRYTLRIPREKETQGTFLFGDSGSGKSQFIHPVIGQAREEARQEPGVCYDPAAEFVQSHYREGLDTILNPLDERFPNWQLAAEIRSPSDLDLIAESFIPTAHIKNEHTRFFNSAAQDVFKLILARKWTIKKMIAVLGDEAAIDELVEGTEIAHKINAKGGPQRTGVLGTLADIGKVLRLVPPLSEDKKDFSLTGWTRAKRRSWLFLTTASDTRDTLRPLISAMLNILMRRLMSVPQAERKNEAWWFIADELHTLNSLPALPEFMVECRKHGIRYVLGTQSKHQLTPQYGDLARTMLASPVLKVFYRCNEPEAARWVSDCIGNEERKRPQISTSLPNDRHGRASTNFTSVVENRPVVSKEEIMNLPNLHAYWKFEDAVVPFKMEYREWNKIHPDFIRRKVEFEKPAVATTGKPSSIQPKTAAPFNDKNNQPKAQSNDKNNQPKQNINNQPKPSVNSQKTSENNKEKTKISNEISLDF